MSIIFSDFPTNSTDTDNEFCNTFVINEPNSKLNIKGMNFNGVDGAKYTKLTIDHEEEDYSKMQDNHPADVFCKLLENMANKSNHEEEKKIYNKTCDDCPTDTFCKLLGKTTDK
ncbi:unnamed protein product [Cunninghamella echinulata]